MPVWRMYPGGGRRHPSQGIERSFFSLISTAEQAGRSIRKTRRMRAHFRIGLTSRKKAKEMLDPTFWTGPAIASLRYHTNPSGSRPSSCRASSFQTCHWRRKSSLSSFMLVIFSPSVAKLAEARLRCRASRGRDRREAASRENDPAHRIVSRAWM